MKRLLLILGMVSVLTAQTATIKNSIIGYTTINEKHDPEGSDDRNGDEYESTISFFIWSNSDIASVESTDESLFNIFHSV